MTTFSSPERLAFDSEALPPAERMDRYRALYGLGTDVIQTGPAPRAIFEGWRLDRAILYHRRLNDISHRRTERRVDGDGFNHWTVTLVLEGWLGVAWGNGLKQIRPGEVLLIDVNQPAYNETRHASIVTLSIALDRLEEIVGSVTGLHGLVLSVDECRLYANYVESLLGNLPRMKPEALVPATSVLCTLLMIALEARGRRDVVAEVGREGTRLSRLRMLVDARLGDPDFDADVAIAESGVSRATLYRLLKPHHGLAAFIRTRRLEQVRRNLSDPGDRRSFAEIAMAAGFAAESHASRVFQDRYGVRPRDYRAAIAAPAAIADPIEQFKSWQLDLR